VELGKNPSKKLRGEFLKGQNGKRGVFREQTKSPFKENCEQGSRGRKENRWNFSSKGACTLSVPWKGCSDKGHELLGGIAGNSSASI